MATKTSHDSETPAKGQQVFTACAFIHKKFNGEEKIFLPKRAETKKFLPGVYELPGGHIDFGEDIVSGLKREILEEFEVKIVVGDPFYVFTYTNEIKGSHSIEVDYFAQFVDPIKNIKLHPDDHSDYGWFDKNEAVEKMASSLKDGNDPEVKAVIKGFELLTGASLNY